MKKNVGNIDRILRLTAGPILFLIAIFLIKSTLLAVILGILGIIWFLTGLIGHCPAYLPFGISTRKAREKSA